MKPKKTILISRFFFYLFLIGFPLSVSFSQSAFILSAFFFFISLRGESREEILSVFPKVFIYAFAMYGMIFLTTLLRNYDSLFDLSFWKSLNRGEVSDFWMSLGIPLAIFHIRKATQLYKIPLFLGIGWLLNLLTGLVSVFTPYRLARFIQLGFQYPEGERLQHFAGGVLDVGTYLPIGLMATHLTYGGLLGLLAPGIFIFFYFQWKERNRNPGLGILLALLFIVQIFLIFYNQSRSIWVGIVFFLLLLIYQNGRSPFSKDWFSFRWKFKNLKWGIAFLLFIGALFFTFSQLYESNWLVRRAVQDVFAKQTTENQRYFILKNSFSMLKNNPLLGIGNNAYATKFKEKSHELIQNHEWLWYELNIVPKGHAHHDFLHFWIVGGLPTAVFFLLFWSAVISRGMEILRFKNWTSTAESDFYNTKYSVLACLGLGCIVIFPAGFFQCYMLDDEVALPFYTIIGILFGYYQNTKMNDDQNKTKNAKFSPKAMILVFSLLSLSLIYWLIRTSAKPEEVHLKKIIWNHNEDHSIVHLDGCLTHNYGETITPKKNPMGIHWEFVRDATEWNPPDRIRVELWDRDSFDQDKLYRAHESKFLFARELDVREKNLSILKNR
ncbi:MAG: O-antigen ligase family protein [Leptospira sp.]|nr:O-antigen ligase family protein [Leptospira sp.]